MPDRRWCRYLRHGGDKTVGSSSRGTWKAWLCAACLVLLGAASAATQPTELFISDYIEGSSNNKAIETSLMISYRLEGDRRRSAIGYPAVVMIGRPRAPWWGEAAALAASILAPVWLGASPARGSRVEPREVRIVFATDDRFRKDALWRPALDRLLDRANRYYGPRFSLSFTLADLANWNPQSNALEGLLDDLCAQVGSRPGVIVAGLTAVPVREAEEYGLASYQDAVLVLAMGAGDDRLADGFLHEVAHVFGAVDVRGGRGLMSASWAGTELDPVNARLVTLHRDRTLAPYRFPLPAAALEDALDLYREALSQAPVAARVAVAQIAIEQGHYTRALEAASAALAADPDSLDALNLHGIALRRLGRIDEAIAAYRAALGQRPYHAPVHYNLAIAFEKQGRPEDAVASYRRTLELQPAHVRALSNLARLYARQGQASLAIDSASRAVAVAPDFPEARVNLALGYLKAGDVARARMEAGRALALNPNLAGAHEVLGVAWLASGHAREAVRSLGAAAALEPTEPRFREELAQAWEAAGDQEQARRAYEEALALDSTDLAALRGLADLYLRLDRRPEALATFLRILAIRPEDGIVHNNVAVLCFRLGDLVQARAHVNRARELGATPHPDFLAALEAAERRRKKEVSPAPPRLQVSVVSGGGTTEPS